MKKLLSLLLISFMLAAITVGNVEAANPRNSATVSKEKQTAHKKVKQTQQQIEENKKKVRRQIDELNTISMDIARYTTEIGALKRKISNTEREIACVSDSISALTRDIEILKGSMAASLRDSRSRRQNMTAVSMILSSENFNQAMKRAGYIKQLDKSRNAKTANLRKRVELLDAKKLRLEALKQRLGDDLALLSEKVEKLEARQSQMEDLVANLKKQGNALEQELTERRKRAAELDAELEKVIAEEARIAAEEERQRLEAERIRKEAEEKRLAEEKRIAEEKKATDSKKKEKQTTSKKKDKDKSENQKETVPAPVQKDKEVPQTKPVEKPAEKTNAKPAKTPTFVESKGHLLFPVEGSYTIVGTFGRSKYSGLSQVEVENSGIDIETHKGANARAVFPGTVSSIFKMDGYHNIVMLRHGEYLTVYAGIDKLAVKKGDTVSAGQSLGQLYSDPTDHNRTLLHFEVRKEREKLNPLDWLEHK